MQIFTEELINEFTSSLLASILLAWDIKGELAAEALVLVFLPFYEFNPASCLVALGWGVIFWKNRGFLFSGVSHLFGLADILMSCFKRVFNTLVFD